MTRLSALLSAAFVLAACATAGAEQRQADRRYAVVINHEEQYSYWFADREAPRGWKKTGFEGSKGEVLDHIEEVWTDMRPLSWRKLDGWGSLDKADRNIYAVVINHEEQYSIWFAGRETPRGWKTTGFEGTAVEALDHIEEVWTDMRPLSWRRYSEE